MSQGIRISPNRLEEVTGGPREVRTHFIGVLICSEEKNILKQYDTDFKM